MDSRVKILKESTEVKGDYIIYWMQETQRTRYNYSLELGIELANKYNMPLYVVFNLNLDYPEAQKRHFKFMFQGLKDVRENLLSKGIKFYLIEGDLVENLAALEKNAAFFIWDKSYLKFQRGQRKKILKRVNCTIFEVENNVLIPVENVSIKEEYSAKTLRDKYKKILEEYLIDFKEKKYLVNSKKELSIKNISDKYLKIEKEELDGKFIGGEKEAQNRLREFIKNNLKNYLKKGPDNESYSKLSPYLHFGNISPLEIYFEIEKVKELQEEKRVFLEEILVRRELAINFVYYNENYDKWEGITYEWAYKTLKNHESDKREYIYTKEELEKCETHDIYWNAAQNQMIKDGYMDGYMRMYWAKKILEWSKKSKEAYEIIMYLNNKYFYDGRDPNSYAGVAWCFGKHDRAWKEREIFGKVRYMNANGLERKYDMEKYLEKYGVKKG